MHWAEWLLYNSVLPLLIVPLYYLASLIIRKEIIWFAPIRDGGVCFYATIISILLMKDLIVSPESSKSWILAPVICWLFSFFVYALAVYTTVYPELENKREIDVRVSLTSVFCAVVTTAVVLGVRIHLAIVI